MGETQTTQTPAVEPLFGALDHIAERGSLLWLVPDRAQRLGLMNAIGKQGLVAWNRARGKYELTQAGRLRLADYRRLTQRQVSAAVTETRVLKLSGRS